METWEGVEFLEKLFAKMPILGMMYHTADETWFGIRWSRLKHEWLMTIKFGKRNGTNGFLLVLDPSRPVVADRLVGEHHFRTSGFLDSPFTILTGRVEHAPMDDLPTGVTGARRDFASRWTCFADDVFTRATDEDLRSELRALDAPSGRSLSLPGEVSGGAPGLGKRR